MGAGYRPSLIGAGGAGVDVMARATADANAVALTELHGNITNIRCFEQASLEEVLSGGATSNGATGRTGPAALSLGSFTIVESGQYAITHTVTGNVNTHGLGISDTPIDVSSATGVANSDIFSTTADRVIAPSTSENYDIDLEAGTYFIGVFSGGGSAADSHEITITGGAGTGQRFNVFNFDDGEVRAYTANDGTEVDISATAPNLPTGWVPCEDGSPTTVLNSAFFNIVTSQDSTQAGDILCLLYTSPSPRD